MANKINYPYGVKSIILENNGGGGAGGDVYLDGNSLVIPEQEQPQPVATIDGVAYYHKQEFDLASLTPEDKGKDFDILTGEEILGNSVPPKRPYLAVATMGPDYPIGSLYAAFTVAQGFTTFNLYIIASGSIPVSANYTSRAFTVVNSAEEVTDDTKICLPNCSAYYGFLSEDGKTFISYYNFKSGSAAEYVDSIKQGNAAIPLKDYRVPNAKITDVGKVVAVTEDGNFELIKNNAKAWYRHHVSIPCTWDFDGQSRSGNVELTVYSNASEPITTIDELYYVISAFNHGISDKYIPTGSPSILTISAYAESTIYQPDKVLCNVRRTVYSIAFPGGQLNAYTYDADSVDISTGNIKTRVNLISNFSADTNSITDTVTPL